MKIESIIYNWFTSNENGEEFTMKKVGIQYSRGICTKIEEHKPQGEGDRFYYDVYYQDGTRESAERIFNINSVIYQKYLM